jgi:hypothetical protein
MPIKGSAYRYFAVVVKEVHELIVAAMWIPHHHHPALHLRQRHMQGTVTWDRRVQRKLPYISLHCSRGAHGGVVASSVTHCERSS